MEYCNILHHTNSHSTVSYESSQITPGSYESFWIIRIIPVHTNHPGSYESSRFIRIIPVHTNHPGSYESTHSHTMSDGEEDGESYC